RIPPPPSRHATPSAPWPWIDIRDPIDQKQLNAGTPPVPEDCDHSLCGEKCWQNYPQSRFPNWTEGQVQKCKIRDAIDNYNRDLQCSIYLLDVTKHGIFRDAGQLRIRDDDARLGEEWDWFKDHKQDSSTRVRALFVENMSGPVLRMLGAKYNIEPFFFSSSLNWIPSRFQEDAREGVGDHITITLPFMQVVPGELVPRSDGSQTSSATLFSTDEDHLVTEMIDTHAPLRIKSRRFGSVDPDGKVSSESALVLDLLSIHLVRNVNGNTIISYHANMDLPTTKADYLHERIRFAGKRTAQSSRLGLTWLYRPKLIRTSSLDLTQQLHIIRAHHLYYSNLLQSFRKTVMFVQSTPNPSLTKEQREICSFLMDRECKTLLKEVDRLNTERQMQEERLRNVMNLVFSSVNIYDSNVMKKMTETALRDSAAMKQISYLTMVFLPAIFTTAVFSMNIKPINPLTNYSITFYIMIAIPLTVVTIWVVVAFQSSYMFHDDTPIWKRLAWPYYLLQYLANRDREGQNGVTKGVLPPTPYYAVFFWTSAPMLNGNYALQAHVVLGARCGYPQFDMCPKPCAYFRLLFYAVHVKTIDCYGMQRLCQVYESGLPEAASRSCLYMSTNNQSKVKESPAYRHAAPSAPWPWIDTGDEVDPLELDAETPLVLEPCTHNDCGGKCWREYPKSHFPNWTKGQVEKCKIADTIDHKNSPCTIYQLEVDEGGIFHQRKQIKFDVFDADGLEAKWNEFKADPESTIRIRALFVKDMNSPALRMLGAKYDIEPFFFSSSLNWIPSSFQEDRREGVGDHITITIPFIRSRKLESHRKRPIPTWITPDALTQEIDTLKPLNLQKFGSDEVLVRNLLSVHLIRNVTGSIIISYHGGKSDDTTAAYLHERIRYAGKSVYWQKMLKVDKDPTLVLLVFVWHAIYAWDEALGDLYVHICELEGQVSTITSLEITEELHIIRAHLLHYASLLGALENTIDFIRTTPNPALEEDQNGINKVSFLERECNFLLREVRRMEKQRIEQENRVKNVIQLAKILKVFSGVNILDSRTAIRDSAAMKQISYLTMLFLPASFAASVFGMNIAEFSPNTYGTVPHYLATALPLTVVSIWILVAYQSRYMFREEKSFFRRLLWPYELLREHIERKGGQDPDSNV
ncbi:hypothetical protein JOM56_004102, partial [Amanita muscaria]